MKDKPNQQLSQMLIKSCRVWYIEVPVKLQNIVECIINNETRVKLIFVLNYKTYP